MFKETIKMRAFFPLLLIAFCGCLPTEPRTTNLPSGQPAATDANQPDRQKPLVSAEARAGAGRKPPIAKTTVAEPNVVAKIGDYVITREELKQRLMKEINPYDNEQYDIAAAPPDAKTVLMKMLAEKAMIMEGRRQNLLEEPSIQNAAKQFRDRHLATLLLQKYLQGKLAVTESEIDERVKSDPKLDRAKAKATLERTKANALIERYYSDIYARFRVKKLSDNFAKAAQIHQRLLNSPKTPRNIGWISNPQIDTDLLPEEKNMVLATYDYGKFTLRDWFVAVCEIVPPRRPADLSTPAGVERLLDIALKLPLFVSEAKLLGLDKDQNFLKYVREWEDSLLLNKVTSEKAKDVNQPTDEQIVDYYNKNKEAFVSRTLKVDQIWCQDLPTSRQVKAELDAGKDFESLRGRYSLDKKGSSFVTSPRGEGTFFQDLWKGEPNQTIGPLKGFHDNAVRWRIVKILEKNPGSVKGYSGDMKDNIKWKLVGEREKILLQKYHKELLAKYPYEIYVDRIADIDPLNIP